MSKRTLGIGLAVVAALLTSACAAGQHAATSEEQSTNPGVNADVGAIHIRGMLIEPPTGPSFVAGDNATIKLVLVNVGNKPDLFESISSPAFADWGAFSSTSDADAVLNPAPTPSGSDAPPPPRLPSASKQVVVQAGSRVSWGTPEASGVLAVFSMSGKHWPGTTVPMTLRFAQAGSITLQVPIGLSGSPNTSPIPEPSSSSIEG